jgi:hypothetical protein
LIPKILACLLLAFLLTGSTPLLAHTLETEGTIGAILHVDPEDDPIIGQPSNFYFEFKDRNNKFGIDKCRCSFFISKDGRELHSQALVVYPDTPTTSGYSTYQFPEKGVYKVRVTGKAITPGLFNDFDLEWDLRVSRDAAQTSSPGLSLPFIGDVHFIHYVGIFLVVVVFVVFLVLDRRRLKSKEAGDQGETPLKND